MVFLLRVHACQLHKLPVSLCPHPTPPPRIGISRPGTDRPPSLLPFLSEEEKEVSSPPTHPLVAWLLPLGAASLRCSPSTDHQAEYSH